MIKIYFYQKQDYYDFLSMGFHSYLHSIKDYSTYLMEIGIGSVTWVDGI